jgi:hypothetical protein
MQGSQDGAALRRLIAALPAPFRETIVLRELDDMSYLEIADVAGVPVGTVMSRLARARAMLLAAWKAQYDPPTGDHPASGAAAVVGRKAADGSMRYLYGPTESRDEARSPTVRKGRHNVAYCL